MCRPHLRNPPLPLSLRSRLPVATCPSLHVRLTPLSSLPSAAVSFQVYDFDGDGVIAREELTDMLKASLSETDLEMSADELEILVNATLKQVAPEMPDGITFDMYMAYATANKERFESAMTINIKQRIARRTSSK